MSSSCSFPGHLQRSNLTLHKSFVARSSWSLHGPNCGLLSLSRHCASAWGMCIRTQRTRMQPRGLRDGDTQSTNLAWSRGRVARRGEMLSLLVSQVRPQSLMKSVRTDVCSRTMHVRTMTHACKPGRVGGLGTHARAAPVIAARMLLTWRAARRLAARVQRHRQ